MNSYSIQNIIKCHSYKATRMSTGNDVKNFTQPIPDTDTVEIIKPQ